MKILKITITGLLVLLMGFGLGLNAQPKNEEIKIDRVLYTSTENFYIEEGEVGIEFTDGSWASINKEKKQFIFQPVETGDWSYELDSMTMLEDVIETYLSMKNIGTY